MNDNSKPKGLKDKKTVKDDFYDRVNYNDSRNIFNSNEPFNPSNRLYTEQALLSHPMWSAIQKTGVKQVDTEDAKEQANKTNVLYDTIISSINKLNQNSSYTRVGCKKCGYGMFI
jgi:hypothetical protein